MHKRYETTGDRISRVFKVVGIHFHGGDLRGQKIYPFVLIPNSFNVSLFLLRGRNIIAEYTSSPSGDVVSYNYQVNNNPLGKNVSKWICELELMKKKNKYAFLWYCFFCLVNYIVTAGIQRGLAAKKYWHRYMGIIIFLFLFCRVDFALE